MKNKIDIVPLLIIVISYLCFNAQAENIKARNNLLEKFKGSQELYVELQKVLFREKIEDRASANKFYDALDKICSSSDPKSLELLVDLLDFYIGEAPSGIISNAIIRKGKDILPLLRRKLVDPIIIGEKPGQDLEKETLGIRNREIIELMEIVLYDIPDSIDEPLSPSKETKWKLFHIQKCLEEIKYKKGSYPVKLDLKNSKCKYETSLTIDGWKRPFKYLSSKSFYFLMSLGEDGKENSGDDIYSPIETELHLFP